MKETSEQTKMFISFFAEPVTFTAEWRMDTSVYIHMIYPPTPHAKSPFPVWPAKKDKNRVVPLSAKNGGLKRNKKKIILSMEI